MPRPCVQECRKRSLNLRTMFDVSELVRKNIAALEPYSSLRDGLETLQGTVLLDANENPFDNGSNRYPDPFQRRLKEKLSGIRGVPASRIFIGNGSDEIIDLCFRIFCEPGQDRAVGMLPSFSMYKVSAQVNDVEYEGVPLDGDFGLSVEAMLKAASAGRGAKLMFVCSPNNPTGNSVPEEQLKMLAEGFRGILVIDEAYIDFSSRKSFLQYLDMYPNVIVLQTLSKAWGMAGLRLGVAFASEEIISLFNKVKHPYNVSSASVEEALRLIGRDVDKEIGLMVSERERMASALDSLSGVLRVYPSDADFLLVRVEDPDGLCKEMLRSNVLIQNRSHSSGTPGCVRISIGTEEQDDLVLDIAGRFYGDYEKSSRSMSAGKNPALRQATVCRKTSETGIRVSLDLDNSGVTYINTGIGFFDHMLDQIARHSGISMRITAAGDLYVDEHHLVEDVAITLGSAIRKALGDKRGLTRYGFALPMDDCRAMVLIDFSGRIDFEWKVDFTREMLGRIHTEMFRHFFKSLCESMQCNLHVEASGDNNHHLAESVFKAFARAFGQAVRRNVNDNAIPSSKGGLD